ncbi:MAG: hypothetical protein U1E17_17670 [Geminicoccaceae bacterium]
MRSLPLALACVALLLGLTLSAPAMAYIGPGAGITMLGALWGVVVAVFLAIGAVLFWPIRALIRKVKGTPPATVSRQDATVREKASS